MERAVFINYRGEDSHSYGALLYTELARQFGVEQVFLDCESISAGVDFVRELLDRVRSARVLLAVIGPHWLTTTDCHGRRRIDSAEDWIRQELVEAFAADVRVVPILTEDAQIPTAEDLPADIAALSRCQARRLRYREPTSDLARIVTDLSSHDPVLAAAARGRDTAPRQLPGAPALFTGRADELAALTYATTTTTTPHAGATVVISAIGGAGGIGKTALALYWAYQHLHRFPDGQLYVNLRGFDPSGRPVPTGEAIRGFLAGLGVDPAVLPVELDAQTARYRSLVAGKAMLIVLDNAYDIDQVTPLLPGSSTCTVLVTSRHHLGGLRALYGAHVLDLDVLSEPDARALLARHLGRHRLAAESAAAEELLAVCGGLPLAVAIVAARAAHHSTFPLAVLAEELRDASARLDGLDAGDLRANLRAVLSWSARVLSTGAAVLFGLLGIAPGPDISLPAAACLAALSPGHAREALRELEHAFLVQQHVPGRYRMHDLIRLYATDTAHQLTENVREAGLCRVLDFYIHIAYTADRLLNPHRQPIQLDPPAPGVQPLSLPDTSAATTWFDIEHPVLLAAHRLATSHAWHHTAWQLAWTLDTFLYWHGHRHDRLAVWQGALHAAAHLPDPTTHSIARRLLGRACAALERHEEGIRHLHHALALAEEHHDTVHQAHAHRALAWAWERRGDHREALEHAIHARDLFRALGHPVWEADALSLVGWYTALLGQFETARSHCQAALTLFQDNPNPDKGAAATLESLGYIAHHTGHHQQAIEYYQQALTLLSTLGQRYQSAVVLDYLGHPLVVLGAYEQARVVWREALQLHREHGRDTDAARVQQQLDDLDNHPDLP